MNKMYQLYIKRGIDFTGAFTALLLLIPFLLIIIILLAMSNHKHGVFFTQSRPGRNGKIFQIIKFKTMNNIRDKEGHLLPDEQRLTCIGNLIRSLSIDELPQLINILKGEMSFIGPRPLLVEYLNKYSIFQARRHEVRPGISGWAQVHGRNTLSWEKKFEYDIWYVDHLNFITDIKILALTILKVIYREGISSGTSVTMEKFIGNS